MWAIMRTDEGLAQRLLHVLSRGYDRFKSGLPLVCLCQSLF